MIKNLKSLKWQKNIYYISNNVIFEISNKKKTNDLDECETYLIDIENASDEIKNAKDGSFITLKESDETILTQRTPYLKLNFDEFSLIYPLQYLISEGDTFDGERTAQSHPDVWNKSYYNLFTQEIIDEIIRLYNQTKDFNRIMNFIPSYLTVKNVKMTKSYLYSYFLTGNAYNEEIAMNGNEEIVTFLNCNFVDTNDNYELNWTKDEILRVISAHFLENSLNNYQEFLKTAEVYYDKESIEEGTNLFFNSITQFSDVPTTNKLKIFPYNNDNNLEFETLFTDYDTWYEYHKN